MLALMELDVSLSDFFEGVIIDQPVRTKGSGNDAKNVAIIDAKDFFEYLHARGVRKSANHHEGLLKVLQLDANYPNLIMFKKLQKAIDEIAKNEELMEGIMAAAAENVEEDGGKLGTIGEEDFKNSGTQNT